MWQFVLYFAGALQCQKLGFHSWIRIQNRIDWNEMEEKWKRCIDTHKYIPRDSEKNCFYCLFTLEFRI